MEIQRQAEYYNIEELRDLGREKMKQVSSRDVEELCDGPQIHAGTMARTAGEDRWTNWLNGGEGHPTPYDSGGGDVPGGGCGACGAPGYEPCDPGCENEEFREGDYQGTLDSNIPEDDPMGFHQQGLGGHDGTMGSPGQRLSGTGRERYQDKAYSQSRDRGREQHEKQDLLDEDYPDDSGDWYGRSPEESKKYMDQLTKDNPHFASHGPLSGNEGMAWDEDEEGFLRGGDPIPYNHDTNEYEEPYNQMVKREQGVQDRARADRHSSFRHAEGESLGDLTDPSLFSEATGGFDYKQRDPNASMMLEGRAGDADEMPGEGNQAMNPWTPPKPAYLEEDDSPLGPKRMNKGWGKKKWSSFWDDLDEGTLGAPDPYGRGVDPDHGPCDVCGEGAGPEMAETYDPRNPQAESVFSHVNCIPEGHEIA